MPFPGTIFTGSCLNLNLNHASQMATIEATISMYNIRVQHTNKVRTFQYSPKKDISLSYIDILVYEN